MRVALKPYQVVASEELIQEVATSRVEVARRRRRQAIVFSAPTGSGKTVMLAACMEAMLSGGDLAATAEVQPDPTLTFLWLSDNPELNEQSRLRIRLTADGIPLDRFEMVESTFDQPTLDPGKVYFLNYQKLRAGGLLSQLSDRRTHTIWETLANTARIRPGGLVTIIDEAHKGLGKTSRDAMEDRTLASAFILGGGGRFTIRGPDRVTQEAFPAVELVVGVSATPTRLDTLLAGDTTRIRRPVQVTPASVRESGLIKDRLVLHGLDTDGALSWTFLGESIRRLREMEAAWMRHTAMHGKAAVLPLLLVQVEDAVGGQVSATPIPEVAAQLVQEWPELTAEGLVHCFGDEAPISLPSGWTVRKENPNDIAGKAHIRVVLFKTALNTGWDCPRAEVLMSFRRSQDATAIAQLVGRMVRTPLGERIEDNETLNAAHFYLPFFDRQNLLRVRDALTGDEGAVAEVELRGDTVELTLRPEGEPMLRALTLVPTEVVPPGRPTPDARRLFRLARLLEQDGLAEDAVGPAAASMVGILDSALTRLKEQDPGLEARLGAKREVSLTTLAIVDGEVVPAAADGRVNVSDTDIEAAYSAAASVVGGEVGASWLRHAFTAGDGAAQGLVGAKLRFLDLVARAEVRDALASRAGRLCDQLMQENWQAVQGLPEARRSAYAALQRTARTVQVALLLPPRDVVFPNPPDAAQAPGHLYVRQGTADDCPLLMNGWEMAVIAEERAALGFLGFLRNLDRKPWAVSYAYDLDGTKPAYPDFVVFRRMAGEAPIIVDLLEPHQAEDSVAKARGMATFAGRHGHAFGRIQMIREDEPGIFRRLNLNDVVVRQQVLDGVANVEDLLRAFREVGVVGPG